MKTTYRFTITYESTVETDTGEILETKIVDKGDRKVSTKSPSKKDDGDPTPKLVLEDNKFCLNSAAVALMQLTAEDKIDIKYEAGKGGSVPIIGTDIFFGTKGGNKLTKSNTVAYRGNKNEELSKYGREFILVKHPSKEGLFVLTSETIKAEQLVGDDNVSIDKEDEVPFDLNLDELVDDKDIDSTTIDSSFFQL